jgi:branched-chain amino acid transport system substrate-binding protein
MLKSIFISLLTAMLMVLGGPVSAATASSTGKKPLRIAHIDPLSGPFAAVGKQLLAHEKFDADRINKEGGANGHKIKIIPFDDKVDPQQAVIQLQKAIDDGIQYVIQGNSSAVTSTLLHAITQHNKRNPNDPVLFLNRAAADPAFTNKRCSFWHFRFADNADMIMNVLTDWIAEQKDIHKVFLLNPDYSFGHDVSKEARKMLKKKRPDIEIVGNVFVPLGKVKDYSPYISQIKASGADTVINGSWGEDMVLLVKAAADYGLKIPLLTYFGNAAGTVKEVGQKGVGRLYVISDLSGDFKNPKLAKLEEKMRERTGWDLTFIRIFDMMDMLKMAVEKAGSTDPVKVAYALEGLKYDSPTGPVIMRGKDHQIQMPMFVSSLQNHMKYGVDTTNLNFHAVEKFSAKDGEMPTTCHMRRPKK